MISSVERAAIDRPPRKIETKLGLAEDLLQELKAVREQVQSALPAEPRNAADEVPPRYLKTSGRADLDLVSPPRPMLAPCSRITAGVDAPA